MKKILFGFGTVLFAASAAFAGVSISSITWQKSLRDKTGPKVKFENSSSIILHKNSKGGTNALRIVARLVNNGPLPVDAIVLRSAFSMRLTRPDKPGYQGVWVVPFWTDERRVAKIAANSFSDVVITNIDIMPVLKRLKDTNFWPDAIKVQLMSEPRQEDENPIVLEAEIKVAD